MRSGVIITSQRGQCCFEIDKNKRADSLLKKDEMTEYKLVVVGGEFERR